jgi:uncharacterized protein (PEP-CTERM system associated)
MLPKQTFLTIAYSGGRIGNFRGFVFLSLISASAASVYAQNQALSITPRISIVEKITDNVSLTTNGKQAEQITEFSPGINIVSTSGRLKGYIDYSLNSRIYAQNTASRSSQNSLNAFGTFEAIDNSVFLDFGSSISQQTIAASGTQSNGNLNLNQNLTESTNSRLSPYIRGQLSSFAEYEARYIYTTNRTQSALASDVVTKEVSLDVAGQAGASPISWSMNARRQVVDYQLGRTTELTNMIGTLSYAVSPQFNVSFSSGQESNNFSTTDSESRWTSGVAFNWRPSNVTKLDFSLRGRSFGESHSLNFEHRSGRSVWKFSDSRDVTTTPSQTTFGSIGSTYDLYFSQFASLEPDEVKRAALVENFLLVNGISPNSSVTGSFLSSAISVQRRQDLAFSLLGVRDTITVIATRTDTNRIDSISTAIDELSNASSVRQNGISMSYAHKLTPDASMNILGAAQQSMATQSQQDTLIRSLNVSLASRLGKKSSATLSIRRVVFDSVTAPYSETSVAGSVNVQF